MSLFVDRTDAGRKLAARLAEYLRRPNTIVLGLPRGGVPVAYEVARALSLPLDVLIVRKLGAPQEPEFAIGAIASGGIVVLNEDVPDSMRDDETLAAEMAAQKIEMRRRERAFRGDRPQIDLRDKTALLIDDGAATGSTMRAAIRAARKLGAVRVIAAIPVASHQAYADLSREADEVVCLDIPPAFGAVGNWYRDFAQTGDAEVRDLLARKLSDG